MSETANKYINLDRDARFVSTKILMDSYVHYDESLNSSAHNYVSLGDGLTLGIVSSQVPEISKAISSILSRSLEDVKNSNEGYLPDSAVERVQFNIISPFGISNLWGTTGHRFVLSRQITKDVSEIIASILVGRSKDTIFFLTGKYNNIKQSSIKEEVNFDLPDDDSPNHKWFDRFSFPDLENFKPAAYHQIANFVVNKEHRGFGYARKFLDGIIKYYSRDHIALHKNKIEHSQHLLCGRGFWQIGDPPWLAKMESLGFYRRAGAESFFIEHDWAPLQKVIWDGCPISNTAYNKHFGMPDIYISGAEFSNKTDQHLWNRIPKVVALSNDPRAKLQYFQAMHNFI